jgi:hypothetical protein
MLTIAALDEVEQLLERNSLPRRSLRVLLLAYENGNKGVALSEVRASNWRDVLGPDFESSNLYCFKRSGVKGKGTYKKLHLSRRGITAFEKLASR